MQRLSEKQILENLQQLPGWTLNNHAIEKEYKLKDFAEALVFINQIGALAEAANHHPELFNVYNKVNIRLSTHDADGITEKDFDLAKEINQL